MKPVILYRKDNSELSVIHWISAVLETHLKRFAKTWGYQCVNLYTYRYIV